MKQLFVKECQVLLSTSYKDFGIWELTVNYIDPESFGNEIVKLTMETMDFDLIEQIKLGSVDSIKKAMLLVLNNHCKCVKEIKHTENRYSTKYYFEICVEKSIKNIINELLM